jgi:negative regulator of sigma E activity
MNSKFGKLKTFFSEKSDQATRSVNEFIESEDTKAAVAWTKATVSHAADEAAELGKRAAKSEMGKDAATGAAIGAVVAVPIPIIGPIFGAIVGAGAGVVMNLKSGGSKQSESTGRASTSSVPPESVHKRLTDLDDLRQRGILSQDEFDVEKNKILGM